MCRKPLPGEDYVCESCSGEKNTPRFFCPFIATFSLSVWFVCFFLQSIPPPVSFCFLELTRTFFFQVEKNVFVYVQLMQDVAMSVYRHTEFIDFYFFTILFQLSLINKIFLGIIFLSSTTVFCNVGFILQLRLW